MGGARRDYGQDLVGGLVVQTRLHHQTDLHAGALLAVGGRTAGRENERLRVGRHLVEETRLREEREEERRWALRGPAASWGGRGRSGGEGEREETVM